MINNVLHKYKTIPGMFDNYQDFYSEMASRTPNGGIVVELGVFLGKSSCFFAEYLAYLNKKVSQFAIDSYNLNLHPDTMEKQWKGVCYPPIDNADNLDHLELCKRYLDRAGMLDRIHIVRDQSWDAARLFADYSVDFVWVDADHVGASVERDLRAWLPKIAESGIIAGHDWGWSGSPGLQDAVISVLGEWNCPFTVRNQNNTWVSSPRESYKRWITQ